MAGRAAAILLSAWLALTLTFAALRVLPGDAITAQLTEAGLMPSLIEQRRAELGLDQPLLSQYGQYLLGLARGDLGISLYTGEPVTDVIASRLGGTLSLAASAFVLMLAVAGVLGLLSAVNGLVGRAASVVIAGAVTLPSYLTGTLVILIFGLATSESSTGLLMASSVLAYHTAGPLAQTFGESIHETRSQPFITAAHGRGLTSYRVMLRHVVPNAVLPALPLIAAQVGFLLGGTIITETVFARAGLGRLMLDAVLRRDYPVVQGLVVLAALGYAASALITAQVARWIDPRTAR